ncbi:MAG: YvcK family protein [Clostridiales bacterium]|nr:YvcK family protein [Clostridiales bacterium]
MENNKFVRNIDEEPEDIILYRPGEYKLGDIESARIVGPKVVAIGGGTGLSTLLKGLKECTENITAIVAVSDDGGGSGILRSEMGILPPGDIRNCIMALANVEPLMSQVISYRFTEGSLSGQSFGNLFLAALCRICGSFDEAVKRMSDVLAITGRVLPVTTADVNLEAEFENGAKVTGESKIFHVKKQQKSRIRRVRLVPENPEPIPEVVEAIGEADMIVLGPGSLYTSIIPNLLVKGVVDAISKSKAVKVYVCNVMTQEGETEGYTAFDHVKSIFQHSRDMLFDICLVNSGPVAEHLVINYDKEGAGPTVIDREKFYTAGIELIERHVIGEGGNLARHNPRVLAAELMAIHARKNPRPGIYGRYDRLILDWMRENMQPGGTGA